MDLIYPVQQCTLNTNVTSCRSCTDDLDLACNVNQRNYSKLFTPKYLDHQKKSEIYSNYPICPTYPICSKSKTCI